MPLELASDGREHTTGSPCPILVDIPARAPIVAESRHPDTSPLLAQAGAAVQEVLRLWPTTLVVLRQSRIETEWRGRFAPAGTEFAIVSSVFHRDDHALDFAHRFEPAVWLDGRTDGEWPIIPFSAGPAVCPGRNVVPLTTSHAVSQVVSRYELDVDRQPARSSRTRCPRRSTTLRFASASGREHDRTNRP